VTDLLSLLNRLRHELGAIEEAGAVGGKRWLLLAEVDGAINELQTEAQVQAALQRQIDLNADLYAITVQRRNVALDQARLLRRLLTEAVVVVDQMDADLAERIYAALQATRD
jgi:hypothetical protein